MSFVILRLLTDEQINKFRKLEKCQVKLNNNNSHLDFNITCVNNSLLPTYTNVFTVKQF